MALAVCLMCLLQETAFGSETGFNESVNFDQASLSPADPTHIEIPVIGIDRDILEYTDEMVAENDDSVDPDYLDEVAWWSGGGKPGTTLVNTVDTPEQNFTTYLYGHSTNNNSRKIVFDDIDWLDIGDEITLETEVGSFVYLVKEVFLIDKTDFTSDSRVLEDTPGRLLLISCWRSWSGSAPTTVNVVVVASLSNYVTNTN